MTPLASTPAPFPTPPSARSTRHAPTSPPVKRATSSNLLPSASPASASTAARCSSTTKPSRSRSQPPIKLKPPATGTPSSTAAARKVGEAGAKTNGASPDRSPPSHALPAGAPYFARFFFALERFTGAGGSHNSIRFPSPSLIHPNFPYSDSSFIDFGSTHTPAFLSCASIFLRSATR